MHYSAVLFTASCITTKILGPTQLCPGVVVSPVQNGFLLGFRQDEGSDKKIKVDIKVISI